MGAGIWGARATLAGSTPFSRSAGCGAGMEGVWMPGPLPPSQPASPAREPLGETSHMASKGKGAGKQCVLGTVSRAGVKSRECREITGELKRSVGLTKESLESQEEV